MMELYFILLVAGVMLLGAEVFVPDGILGIIGGLFLLGASALGFVVFPPAIAALGLAGTIALACFTIFMWARFFPKTPAGKRMMVSQDLKNAHACDESLLMLQGQQGIVTAELRPSGFAEINGRRVDVISASGDLMPLDTRIQVMRVEGNRVLVDRVAP
jgi:membrane-bound serine protease (ClpP class)